MTNYYLGGDVSKGYSDFVILDQNKEVVEPNFQLDDTFEGHRKLHHVLETFFSTHPNCQLLAAVESTGSYENNWIKCLLNCASEFQIKVARLNPFGVSHNSKADMKRNQTDKISAKDVAQYLIAHPEKIIYINEMPAETIKEQYNYIELLKKQKTQLLNLLGIDLYKANPQLLVYCRNRVPRWVLNLLQHYPTAKHLAAASSEALQTIPFISAGKAARIIVQAKKSIASNLDQITAERISELATGILEKGEQITAHKKRLISNKKMLPKDVKTLTSFTGIGIYSAVGLLIHFDDIERFANCKKISSFFGVHPIYRLSGDGSAGFHMSKRGDAAVRNILYMIAFSAIVHNPLIRELYQRL
jgi:transposase